MNEILLFYLCGLMISAGLAMPITARYYPQPSLYAILFWLFITSGSWLTFGVICGRLDTKLTR